MKYDVLSREEGTKVLYRSTDRRVSLFYKPSCSPSPSSSPSSSFLLRYILLGDIPLYVHHHSRIYMYAEYFYWFIGRVHYNMFVLHLRISTALFKPLFPVGR